MYIKTEPKYDMQPPVSLNLTFPANKAIKQLRDSNPCHHQQEFPSCPLLNHSRGKFTSMNGYLRIQNDITVTATPRSQDPNEVQLNMTFCTCNL